jgi:hypothetical protein
MGKRLATTTSDDGWACVGHVVDRMIVCRTVANLAYASCRPRRTTATVASGNLFAGNDRLTSTHHLQERILLQRATLGNSILFKDPGKMVAGGVQVLRSEEIVARA